MYLFVIKVLAASIIPGHSLVFLPSSTQEFFSLLVSLLLVPWVLITFAVALTLQLCSNSEQS